MILTTRRWREIEPTESTDGGRYSRDQDDTSGNHAVDEEHPAGKRFSVNGKRN